MLQSIYLVFLYRFPEDMARVNTAEVAVATFVGGNISVVWRWPVYKLTHQSVRVVHLAIVAKNAISLAFSKWPNQTPIPLMEHH
jgi:hypothetical protein